MSDFQELDYYQLLGVARSATQEEIKRAYRREISQYHPDRFVHGSPEQQRYAEGRSQRLTEAYATLSNFKSRSTYNTSQRATVAPATSAQPLQPRDYQAELYDQATAHLQAGRTLQAIAVLRQLQQVNPFYRDSADLLAQAEQQSRVRSTVAAPASRRPMLLIAGLGGLALVGVTAWMLGQRVTGQSQPAGLANNPVVASTVAPEPTGAVAGAATAVPTLQATIAPTAAPTAIPTAIPTAAPTAIPTPTAQATSEPTAQPIVFGSVLFSDDFSGGGWADTSGAGWNVGFTQGRYRIAVDPSIGAIWSYRTLSLGDHSIAADVQVTRGDAGLLLGFVDANSYLSFTINPQQTSFRLEQRRGDFSDVLAGGQTAAIIAGARAINRLEAQEVGDRLRLLVNDRVVGDVTLNNPPTGSRFGVISISGATAAEGLFDNLNIRSIQAGS